MANKQGFLGLSPKDIIMTIHWIVIALGLFFFTPEARGGSEHCPVSPVEYRMVPVHEEPRVISGGVRVV